MADARTWLTALRAYSYPASVVPIAVGTALAYRVTGEVRIGAFLLATVAGLLIHTGCNLINDLYDHRRGVDREGTFGGSGVLVSGALSPAEVAAAGWGSLAAAAVIGLVFVVEIGWPMVLLGAFGLAAAALYTATPFAAKIHGLGNPLVFAAMGVGMTIGGEMVQTGEASLRATLASLPVAFLVTAILHANDTRDLADDEASGIRTAAMALGARGARAVLSALLAAAYVVTIVLTLAGTVPWAALAPLATAPLALGIHRTAWQDLSRRGELLRDAPERSAKLHLAFGVLYTLGIALG